MRWMATGRSEINGLDIIEQIKMKRNILRKSHYSFLLLSPSHRQKKWSFQLFSAEITSYNQIQFMKLN